MDNERAAALRKPLGIVFVTFATAEDAKKTYQDFQSSCSCGHTVSASSLSQQLKPQQWQVAFAPSRTDIFWENLSVPTQFWYLRAFMINLMLFIVLFFLTTPAYVVNLVNTLNLTNRIEELVSCLNIFLKNGIN